MLKPFVQDALESRVTLEKIDSLFRKGCISSSEYCAYMAIWEWSACRLSGDAGRKQSEFYDKFGRVAFFTRINKVRKACGFEPIAF